MTYASTGGPKTGIKGKYSRANYLSSTLLSSVVLLECLGEPEKESMTMVKTFTSPHCYSQGITVQSKGISASGTPWIGVDTEGELVERPWRGNSNNNHNRCCCCDDDSDFTRECWCQYYWSTCRTLLLDKNT
jgi:hypothetical protein